MSCLPFAANSGHTLATFVVGSISPRSISIRPASAVTFLVDDRLAVDIDGDGGADLLAVGDGLTERLGELVEAGVTVALNCCRLPGHFVPALRMSFIRPSCVGGLV